MTFSPLTAVSVLCMLMGPCVALGNVNVKKMDSGVTFPGWESTTNKRYERVFGRN